MPDTNLQAIIESAGYVGMFAIVLSESGILLGFFIPGNSLLVTAGFLASVGFFNIHLLVLVCFLASVAGNTAGYYIGLKWGRRLFHKENSLLFNKNHLMRAEKFYETHGGKTIIMARFINVIRTFAPIVAGIGQMNHASFSIYNLLGAFVWTGGLTYAGYYLGRAFTDNSGYIILIVYLVIFFLIYPHVYKRIKTKDREKNIK